MWCCPMVMMSDNRPWRVAFWALVLATLWLSLMPAERIPSAFHFWDKAQHALGFAALAYMGLTGYARQTRQVLVGLALFGIVIEVMQHLSGWRHGDWLDWVADCVGLLIGYAALRATNLLRR